MITEEAFKEMAKVAQLENDFTRKILEGYQLHSVDITNLVKAGILERIAWGHYRLASLEEIQIYLEEYSKVPHKRGRRPKNSFQNTTDILEQFYISLCEKDYSKAQSYLNILCNREDNISKEDCTFYMYLLNFITEQTLEYSEEMRKIRYSDLRLPLQEEPYQILEDKIRLSAFNKKFSLANRQMKELLCAKNDAGIREKIMEVLIQDAANMQIQTRKQLLFLIKEEKYDEILTILEKCGRNSGLGMVDQCILSLTRELVNILETGEIPEANITISEKVFHAIEGQNYSLALALAKQHEEKYGTANDNHIYLLLEKINQAIEQASFENDQQRLRQMCVQVASFFLQDENKNGMRKLEEYLQEIGKSEYTFWIGGLIQLSMMEQDATFQKPVEALKKLEQNLDSFHAADYILDFYEVLSQNKCGEARIYLDMIQQSMVLGQEIPIAAAMEEVLKNTEVQCRKIKRR